MGRCKGLGSLKSSLWSAPQPSGACVFTSWVSSLWGVAAVWWLLDGRYSFLPESPQGLRAHAGRLQSLMTVTSFVYWCGRQYSIYHCLYFYQHSIYTWLLLYSLRRWKMYSPFLSELSAGSLLTVRRLFLTCTSKLFQPLKQLPHFSVFVTVAPHFLTTKVYLSSGCYNKIP